MARVSATQRALTAIILFRVTNASAKMDTSRYLVTTTTAKVKYKPLYHALCALNLFHRVTVWTKLKAITINLQTSSLISCGILIQLTFRRNLTTFSKRVKKLDSWIVRGSSSTICFLPLIYFTYKLSNDAMSLTIFRLYLVSAKTCSALIESSGTNVSPSTCLQDQVSVVGDLCKFSCSPGYELPSNEDTLLCLPTGSWNASLIYCQSK